VVVSKQGKQGCTVGYLSRHIASDVNNRLKYVEKMATARELYKFTEDWSLKRVNLRGYGEASFSLLDVIKIG
jgi:hypothetical protein